MRPQKPREGVHKVHADLVGQVGRKLHGADYLGVPTVAAFLDITPETLYKHLDPAQSRDGLSHKRVRAITEHFEVTAAAEDLARLAGGEFVPLSIEYDPAMPWCSKIGAQMHHEGMLHGAIGEALADGKIDAREGACILPLIDQRMEDLRRLRARVEAEMKVETVSVVGAAA